MFIAECILPVITRMFPYQTPNPAMHGVSVEEEMFGSPMPPEVIRVLNSQTVADGSMARLECSVDGNPKPNIAWFRDANLIQPSPDFMQFYDVDNQCSLVIKEVFPEDTGRYTMVAKNPFGTATCSAEVIVEDVAG